LNIFVDYLNLSRKYLLFQSDTTGLQKPGVMKKALIILACIAVTVGLNGQKKTITGKITTFKTIAVGKALVQVKSSNEKFYSDSLGLFSVTCDPEDILFISAEGFVKAKVRIKEKTNYALVNLRLESGEEAIEYAVGYGHVKDKEKLYAVANQNKGMDLSHYRNIYEAISGNFTGVQVINGDILIRSSANFGGGATALLIVDGRQVSKDSFANIETTEIENITILKDASAAIYGVQGGNGVVIVETKRGSKK
jgi:TonB-dependent SusC/RagA subfamily outer membrane receptor